jgi:hypothetical protein
MYFSNVEYLVLWARSETMGLALKIIQSLKCLKLMYRFALLIIKKIEFLIFRHFSSF